VSEIYLVRLVSSIQLVINHIFSYVPFIHKIKQFLAFSLVPCHHHVLYQTVHILAVSVWKYCCFQHHYFWMHVYGLLFMLLYWVWQK